MSKLSFSAIAAACMLAFGCVAPVARSADSQGTTLTPVKIKMDWTFQGPESVYVYGKNLGLFKKSGIDAIVRRGDGTTKTVLQTAAGSVQFGWAGMGGLIKFDLTHPNNRLVAVYIPEAFSPDAVVTIKGRGIKTPKDLDGKTIDGTPASGAHALFKLFAKHAGINVSSIKFKDVNGQLREPMMVRGGADALVGFTTSSILSVHKLGVPLNKIVVFRYSDYGINQYGRALFARASYIKAHPKVVRAVVRAVNESYKAAIPNPLASAKTLPSRDPLVVVSVECNRLRMGLEHLTLSKKYKADGLSSVEPDRLHKSVLEIKSAYHMSGDLPNKEIYTDAFLPPQSDRIPPALGTCPKLN